MDKVKILMEKYGLTEKLAKDVFNMMSIQLAASQENDTARTIQENNQIAIEQIVNAEQTFINRKVEGSSFVPYNSEIIIPMQYRERKTKIKSIKFMVEGTKGITIDDPDIIESIRIHLSETKFVVNEKRKRGNQPNPPFYKQIVKMLMEQAPTGKAYSKHVWIGRIFSEFLQEFKDCNDSPYHLQKKIADLLRDKKQ